ncbi:MAG: ribosomal protein S6--L-glutamate ligase [Rhodothermales bacterium]|jgi:ribosomal protein S6--L-glutamate ligase
MNIGILSRQPRIYSTRRLKEAAKARGINVRVFDTLKYSLGVEHGSPNLRYNGRPMPRLDAIIPRIGTSITTFGTAVVRQFEQLGVYTQNSALAISKSRDKLRSFQEFSRHDIGLPATEFVRRREDILPAIERVGGAPVIIKLLEGTQGVGVILAESAKVAEAIIETLQSTKQSVLIQKFVAESKGKDVRAFVVGDKVIGAMRRTAVGQEFRSNVHRGGRTETIALTPEYEKTAVRAAHIMGLQVAGVDMLEGTDGPQVMEVNSSPGLEGIEKATGLDIAGIVIDHLMEHAAFPDVDLRQRLTLKSGFGVIETTLNKRSLLTGKSLRNCGLREMDVVVLVIERPDTVLANPDADEVFLAGDKVLLFGNRATLKTFLPKQRVRRKKGES